MSNFGLDLNPPEHLHLQSVAFSADLRLKMARRRRIYEGKAKILFEGPEPGTLVQYFKDEATAFNNKKQGMITGKGVLNNRISEYLMMRLTALMIPSPIANPYPPNRAHVLLLLLRDF